ncbi:MAG: MFS transporter [Betaproteobacteria bacterium]|nr:MFS transporter [Betaproteobacteria bacterium]
MNLSQLVVLVLLSWSGYKGVRILNTLYALELGASPFAVGVLLAMYALFPVVLAVYAGKVADRYGVRVPLLGGMVAMAAGIFLPFLHPSLPLLFVAAAIVGLGFIFVQISMQSITGSLGAGAERTRNFNIYALAIACTDLIGPVSAGFSIDQFGHVPTFLMLAAMNAAAVLGLLLVYRRIPATAQKAGDRGAQRMMDLVRQPALRRIFIASAVVMTGIDLYQLYMPLYGHAIGLSASAIGMVLGAFAAAAFVVRALIPVLVRRLGEHKTLAHSLFLAAATFLLIPFFQNAVMLGAVSFVLGLGLGLGQPLSTILTYNHSPAGRVGEALGLRIAVNNITHVAVPVIFGAVGAAFGLSPVFWVNSVFLALGGYSSRGGGAARA